MALPIIVGSDGSSGGGATTCVIDFSLEEIQSGDYLIAFIDINQVSRILQSVTGATLLASPNGDVVTTAGGGDIRLFTVEKVLAGTETDVTFTFDSATSWAGGYIILRGVDTSDPIDVVNYEIDNIADTDMQHAGVTTTVSDTLLLFVSGKISLAGASVSPPTGMTQQFLEQRLTAFIAYLATEGRPTAGATGERETFDTTGGNGREITGLIAIKSSTSGGTSPAPTANAGVDQNVNEGVTVNLDGTGSTAGSGETITNYAWTIANDGGTGITTGDITDASTSTPSLVAPQVGVGGASVTVQLQVTQSDAQTDTDTMVINISDTTGAITSARKIASSDGSGWTTMSEHVATAGGWS